MTKGTNLQLAGDQAVTHVPPAASPDQGLGLDMSESTIAQGGATLFDMATTLRVTRFGQCDAFCVEERTRGTQQPTIRNQKLHHPRTSRNSTTTPTGHYQEIARCLNLEIFSVLPECRTPTHPPKKSRWRMPQPRLWTARL